MATTNGMIPKVQDPLIKQTIAKLEASKMEPEMRKSYDQIAAAGMKLMWAEGEVFEKERQEILDRATSPEAIPMVAARVAVKIVVMVQNESKQQDMLLAIGPASTLFLMHTLEFIEVVTKIPITADILAQAQRLTKEGLMAAYKITPEVLERVAREYKPKGTAPEPATPPAPPQPPAGV